MSDGSPLPRLLSAGSRRLYEYIRQGQYDAVLCVHVFAGVLLQQTLQDFPLTLRTGFVATDYTSRPVPPVIWTTISSPTVRSAASLSPAALRRSGW